MENAFIQLKMSTVIPSRCQAKACVGGRPSSARSSPSWFGRSSSIRRIAGSISSHVLRSHPRCSDLTYASDHEQSSSAFFGAFDTDSEVLEWPREPSPQATPTTRALFLLPRSFSIPAGGFSDDLDTPSRPHVLASDARHHDHALGPRRARFHGRGGGNRRWVSSLDRTGWIHSFHPLSVGCVPPPPTHGQDQAWEANHRQERRHETSMPRWDKACGASGGRCRTRGIQHRAVARSKVNCGVRQCPGELQRKVQPREPREVSQKSMHPHETGFLQERTIPNIHRARTKNRKNDGVNPSPSSPMCPPYSSSSMFK